MSKPEIVIERKIHCGGYCYIVRELPDFPDGTEISYRDAHSINPKDDITITVAGIDELDALIECLEARRTEVKDYQDSLKAKKTLSG